MSVTDRRREKEPFQIFLAEKCRAVNECNKNISRLWLMVDEIATHIFDVDNYIKFEYQNDNQE